MFGLVSFCQVGILFKVTRVGAVEKVPFSSSLKGKGHLTSRMADLKLPFRPTWMTSGRSLDPETERSAVESTEMEASRWASLNGW